MISYSDKIKGSKPIIDLINTLGKDQSLDLVYGKPGRDNRDFVVKIRAYEDFRGDMSYSIWGPYGSGMNIDKIGRTTMKAYTYDMMSQKTTYTFNLYDFRKLDLYEAI